MSAKTNIELELAGATAAVGEMTPAGNLCQRAARFIAEQREEADAIEREAAARALDALLAELSAPSNGLVHRCGGQEYIDTATLTAVAQGLMRRGGADAD